MLMNLANRICGAVDGVPPHQHAQGVSARNSCRRSVVCADDVHGSVAIDVHHAYNFRRAAVERVSA
jgi:hypothetical protein